MRSMFSIALGQMQMIAANPPITDKHIFAAASSPSLEGLKRSAASTRATVAPGHVQGRIVAGIGLTV